MDGHVIDEQLQQELSAIAESVDCELFHVKFANNQLQVFLDRPDGGVTIEHCQAVSRQVSALLDVHDFSHKRYVLEVSSPGLDRELFGPRDYIRFLGRLARVTFTDSEDRKQTAIGRLQEFIPDDSSEAGGEQAGDQTPDTVSLNTESLNTESLNTESLNTDNRGVLILQQEQPTVVRHRIPTRAIHKARLEIEI